MLAGWILFSAGGSVEAIVKPFASQGFLFPARLVFQAVLGAPGARLPVPLARDIWSNPSDDHVKEMRNGTL